MERAHMQRNFPGSGEAVHFGGSKVSAFTANKEIRYLKATFNFGKKKGWITENPVVGLSFLPMAKRLKYVPAPEDINMLIALANPEVQDYLLFLRDTMGPG